jgi:hypothetical protein
MNIYISPDQCCIIYRRKAAWSLLDTKIFLFEAEINEYQARPQGHTDSWKTHLGNADGFKFWLGIRQYCQTVKRVYKNATASRIFHHS